MLWPLSAVRWSKGAGTGTKKGLPLLVVAPATHGRQMKDQQLAAQQNAAKLELQV